MLQKLNLFIVLDVRGARIDIQCRNEQSKYLPVTEDKTESDSTLAMIYLDILFTTKHYRNEIFDAKLIFKYY